MNRRRLLLRGMFLTMLAATVSAESTESTATAAPAVAPGADDLILERQKAQARQVAEKNDDWDAHHCRLFLGENSVDASAYFAKNAPANATGTWRWGVINLLRTYFQFNPVLSDEAKQSIMAVCQKARDDNPWSANGSNPQSWPWGNSENKRLTSQAVHVLVDQATGRPGLRHAASQAAAKAELVGILREGASEFNSPHYSSQSLKASLLLAEFCTDSAIRELARMVVDQYLADIALESIRGVRGGPYFRGYEREIFDGAEDDAVWDFSYFFFGNGRTTTGTTSSHWITTTYRPPQVVVDLATHPTERGTFVQSGRSRFGREGLQSFYFYMQPGFSLSCMQNRVPHRDDATVPSHANQVWEFTTDDPRKILGAYRKVMKNLDSPHTANMQYKNVLFFAGDFMDYNKNLGPHESETQGEKMLHFYRVATWAGDAYVGITHYPGANGGILEVRSGKEVASWNAFKEAVRKAPSSCADWGKHTTYTSTTSDVIRYDNGEAKVNDKALPLKEYPRYNGTYMDSAWDGGQTRITFGGKSLTLDYRDPEKPTRTESGGSPPAAR